MICKRCHKKIIEIVSINFEWRNMCKCNHHFSNDFFFTNKTEMNGIYNILKASGKVFKKR